MLITISFTVKLMIKINILKIVTNVFDKWKNYNSFFCFILSNVFKYYNKTKTSKHIKYASPVKMCYRSVHIQFNMTIVRIKVCWYAGLVTSKHLMFSAEEVWFLGALTRMCRCTTQAMEFKPHSHPLTHDPFDMKGCICHFTKWQIHPFISKGTLSAMYDSSKPTELRWPNADLMAGFNYT